MNESEKWKYTDISKLDFSKLIHSSGSITIEESKNVYMPKSSEDFAHLRSQTILSKIVCREEPKNKIEEIQQEKRKEITIIVKENDQAELKIKKTSVIGNMNIVLEKDATLKMTEELSGNEMNVCLDTFILKQGSKLYYNYIQNMDGSYDFTTKMFIIGKNSKLRATIASFGSKISRTDIVTYIEKESDSEINCIFISNDNQHIDINAAANHNDRNTKNKMLTKGILLDNSSSVVRGLIKIGKNASMSSSFFESHALIDGNRCTSNSVPSLEIDNNDVICKHASTVGKMDDSQLYYLTSRGLTEKDAKKLLMLGYLEPLIQKSSIYEECKKIIEGKINV